MLLGVAKKQTNKKFHRLLNFIIYITESVVSLNVVLLEVIYLPPTHQLLLILRFWFSAVLLWSAYSFLCIYSVWDWVYVFHQSEKFQLLSLQILLPSHSLSHIFPGLWFIVFRLFHRVPHVCYSLFYIFLKFISLSVYFSKDVSYWFIF